MGNMVLTHVLSSCEVRGNGELLLSLVFDEIVDCPGRAVKALLVDFGPDRSGTIVLKVGGNVGQDGTLVRRRNNVISTSVVVLSKMLDQLSKAPCV